MQIKLFHSATQMISCPTLMTEPNAAYLWSRSGSREGMQEKIWRARGPQDH